MLSSHKTILRAAEISAALTAIAALGLALAISADLMTVAIISQVPIISATLLCLASLPACILIFEYARSKRSRQGLTGGNIDINKIEIFGVAKWAPMAEKVAAAVGILLSLAAGFFFGEISWGAGDPLASNEASAMLIHVTGLSLLALPIIGSAVRMPGNFADN